MGECKDCARVVDLEYFLRRVLGIAPRCFKRDCQKAAVYQMPTTALGDAVLVCEEHRTSDGNEFDEGTVELRYASLHREIRRALGVPKQLPCRAVTPAQGVLSWDIPQREHTSEAFRISTPAQGVRSWDYAKSATGTQRRAPLTPAVPRVYCQTEEKTMGKTAKIRYRRRRRAGSRSSLWEGYPIPAEHRGAWFLIASIPLEGRLSKVTLTGLSSFGGRELAGSNLEYAK